ncbi:sulfite exporter TauE/SafE family protein [Mucilaginibacter sp. 14171R-50]|nr:sulfite exporter TauE/SafE family protein [Mucilaginibacter sp. 14171R-50]
MSSITIHILLIIFIATVFRSAFGFGESLVAVPLLALWVPLNIAVPLSVLVSVTIAGIVVVQDWKKIHFRSASGLIMFTLIGIPLGLLLLINTDERIVKAVLGAIILIFSVYLLTGKQLKELKTDNFAWLFGCGLLAGILDGAYGLNGPPLVIYGAKRRWSAQHFRATLQGYFFIASMVGTVGYWFAGLLVTNVIHYYLLSLPVMVPAVFIGRAINNRLHGEKFFKYVYVVLSAIGLFLLVRAVIN